MGRLSRQEAQGIEAFKISLEAGEEPKESKRG